jgi:predicted  nucleic acid-binding Zn-ribbon protein
VERGLCRGCGVTLPSGDVQRARAGQELVRCNSCGRILYVA